MNVTTGPFEKAVIQPIHSVRNNFVVSDRVLIFAAAIIDTNKFQAILGG
ncbi:hypothetical protein JCM19233_4288 [Vibrio astriarenae]|nr:hypothetical protein JCM19233_4288 [Vibrio sp. C7]